MLRLRHYESCSQSIVEVNPSEVPYWALILNPQPNKNAVTQPDFYVCEKCDR